jgi:hypothetical protein
MGTDGRGRESVKSGAWERGSVRAWGVEREITLPRSTLHALTLCLVLSAGYQ